MNDAHSRDIKSVLEDLKSSVDGLTKKEAAARLLEYGSNELPREKERSRLVLFLKQFHSTLNYILLFAAGISYFAGHFFDAVAIFIIVFLNGAIGYYQERRAEKAIAKLRKMSVPIVTVKREGKISRIETQQLVPGDVVVVAEGVRVPADMRLMEAHDVHADESALTGESVPASKEIGEVSEKASVGDRKNMLHMGTMVTSGEAVGVVVLTGQHTEFGKITTSLLFIKREKTPFEKRIDRLGTSLGIIAVLASALIFIAGISRGLPLLDMFLFAVATAVAVIPEGLPFVLVFVLSIGVWRMAKRNSIIRHMPAVETLGIVDVICSDKTGTLTENKMTVRQVSTVNHQMTVTGEGWKPVGKFLLDDKKVALGEHSVVTHLLRIVTLCNAASIEEQDDQLIPVGDPTEAALVVLGQKAGFDRDTLLKTEKTLDEIPFSSDRKYRAILHEYHDTDENLVKEIMVVGALEEIMKSSSRVMKDHEGKEINSGLVAELEALNNQMADKAMRVLAVASKRVGENKKELHQNDISELTIYGLIGMIDPPREGIHESIEKAKKAGIRLIMNTGDHKATAIAIAKEIGMLDEEDGVDGKVFTDTEVLEMSDDQLKTALNKAVVFARVSPQTKLRIVDLLQQQGHAVAMTGDGINDAPALKQADIGVAMGINGTDVTKEVADMVLSDDNFGSIISAVEEGRIVFRNVKQTTGFLVMTNAGEAVTILATIAVGLPLPLLPAQILWLNIVTDSLTDNALAVEGVHGNEMKQPPRPKDTKVLSKSIMLLTVLTSILMAGGTILLFTWALGRGDLEYARSVAFLSMVLFQLWNIFGMRSAHISIFKLGLFSNKWVVLTVLLSIFLVVFIMYVPWFAPIFRLNPLGGLEWFLAAICSSSVFFLVEMYKVLLRRNVIPEHWVQS